MIIFVMLCIDFVSFVKSQILREFQNIEKFIIFWKKYDFTKRMHSFVSNVHLNRLVGKSHMEMVLLFLLHLFFCFSLILFLFALLCFA